MLDAKVFQPDDAGVGTPALVMLHGRGADPSDLVGLRGGFPRDVALVLPRAPHPGSPWGYGPGWAWYRYVGEDRPEEESFRTAQAELEAFLDGLPDLLGYTPGPVVLGGFSQGGTMSLGYALRHPGAVPAVLVFSGFLPKHPDVQVAPATVAGTAFWWGHGTLDPAIPHTLASRGRTALKSAGAELEKKDYPMGHGISPAELADAAAWAAPHLAAG